MSGETISIFWFRRDLRLADNPGLKEAANSGRILPIYILDESEPEELRMGGASRWWLHHSLISLNKALENSLNLYRGKPDDILAEIIKRHDVRMVCWNRCYDPWRVGEDRQIKENLKAGGIATKSFNGSLLWEPWDVLKADKTPYRVFTPFYRKGCLGAVPPRKPTGKMRQLSLVRDERSLSLDDLHLLPRTRWDRKLEPHWKVGEEGAQKRLAEFLQTGLEGYRKGRDFPSQENVSRLSPYLHFGEISPHQIWHTLRMQGESAHIDHFCTELGWREFSHHLLYHFPTLPSENWQKKFDAFPWTDDPGQLSLWHRGMTGYPIVDAGMRELWQTGYMHNRVRMIVASFLTKNLLIDWRHGARWFQDCLVDADLANNSSNWQWVAGCGADAAPYFRIFNPVTQGEKIDADGAYTRQYVPELAKLPDRYLFKPWEATADVLAEANVALGESYPLPVVDIRTSRERALAAYAGLKSPSSDSGV